MNRRAFLRIPAVAFVLSQTHAWAGIHGADSKDAFSETVAWFASMFRPLSDLADAVDHLRLIRSLQGLAAACEHMIDDKADIVNELDRRPIDRVQLRASVSDLSSGVDAARGTLSDVRSVLKQAYRDQGSKAGEELTDVLAGRKSWVEALKPLIDTSPESDLFQFRGQANDSLEALKQASQKLDDLIGFLKRQRS